MAERYRSNDGRKETEEFTEGTPAPEHSGRAQGDLERDVATRDEKKQAEKGAGASRVTKGDEAGDGNLGGHHGTGSEDGS
ncbi:hypothetical protein [Histidinibacterium aquaticum]|uniref:Uncharacterized protein n=1 Tax=Histidinibacterium aquaticum TaxID=2613962 RepID=A0A5J5GPF3_9RHOB|nr:hypothetical protein [Histidinibacterium aquaticum]KAA9009322.1 hypothetical protein F3S47_08740 [Histidinibacterium aquaticum]